MIPQRPGRHCNDGRAQLDSVANIDLKSFPARERVAGGNGPGTVVVLKAFTKSRQARDPGRDGTITRTQARASRAAHGNGSVIADSSPPQNLRVAVGGQVQAELEEHPCRSATIFSPIAILYN